MIKQALLPLFNWLGNSSIGHAIADSKYAFAIIEVFHLFGIILLLGSASLMALRLVGLTMREQKISDLSRQLGWFGGRLELLDADAPDAALEDAAFQFVDEWIWYDEEEAALERVRYANYGYPVRGANVKSEKLALLRAQGGAYSTLDEQARAARAAVVAQWLSK